MTSKFSPKLRFSTVLITSAMLVSGCATDPSSFGSLQPIYRVQGNLPGVSAQAFYETGKRYFTEKRYGLALEAFQSELRYNGKSVKALNGIAACYDKLNRYDLAVNYYYQALGVDPESTRTLSNLGYSFLLQRRDADAKRVLGLALSKDPGNVFIKRNLALATSHVQELAKVARSAPKDDEIKQVSSATEQPAPAEATVAVDTKPSEESSATTAGSNRTEPAASGMIVRVADGETQVSEAEPVPTVAEVAVVEEPAEQAPMTSQVDEVSPQMNTEAVVSEPATVIDVAVADSGLLPAIEIISQLEEPAEQAPMTSQVDEVSPQMNTEAVVSEPVTVTEVAVADSGLLPAIEIISQLEEPAEQAPEPLQVDEISPQMNIEVAASEPATVTEVAVADSGLLPTIDIASQVEEPAAQEVPGIATIDVDVALAEANIVKVADNAVVTTSGVEKQQGAMQDEQSISPLTAHGSSEYTIEVSNGNGWNGMARLLGNHLNSNGERVVRLTNADTFNYKDTVIYYSSGKRGVAEQVAGKFPVQARLQETNWNRQDIDVRVVIGEDVASHAPVIRRSLYAWDNNDVSKSVAAAVEVSNGNGRNGMARLLKSVLVSRGDSIRRVTNADNFEHRETVIYFSKGRHKDAQQLAAKLPVQATLKETQDNRGDIDLRVVLGKDFLNYEVAMRQIMDANA